MAKTAIENDFVKDFNEKKALEMELKGSRDKDLKTEIESAKALKEQTKNNMNKISANIDNPKQNHTLQEKKDQLKKAKEDFKKVKKELKRLLKQKQILDDISSAYEEDFQDFLNTVVRKKDENSDLIVNNNKYEINNKFKNKDNTRNKSTLKEEFEKYFENNDTKAEKIINKNKNNDTKTVIKVSNIELNDLEKNTIKTQSHSETSNRTDAIEVEKKNQLKKAKRERQALRWLTTGKHEVNLVDNDSELTKDEKKELGKMRRNILKVNMVDLIGVLDKNYSTNDIINLDQILNKYSRIDKEHNHKEYGAVVYLISKYNNAKNNNDIIHSIFNELADAYRKGIKPTEIFSAELLTEKIKTNGSNNQDTFFHLVTDINYDSHLTDTINQTGAIDDKGMTKKEKNQYKKTRDQFTMSGSQIAKSRIQALRIKDLDNENNESSENILTTTLAKTLASRSDVNEEEKTELNAIDTLAKLNTFLDNNAEFIILLQKSMQMAGENLTEFFLIGSSFESQKQREIDKLEYEKLANNATEYLMPKATEAYQNAMIELANIIAKNEWSGYKDMLTERKKLLENNQNENIKALAVQMSGPFVSYLKHTHTTILEQYIRIDEYNTQSELVSQGETELTGQGSVTDVANILSTAMAINVSPTKVNNIMEKLTKGFMNNVNLSFVPILTHIEFQREESKDLNKQITQNLINKVIEELPTNNYQLSLATSLTLSGGKDLGQGYSTFYYGGANGGYNFMQNEGSTGLHLGLGLQKQLNSKKITQTMDVTSAKYLGVMIGANIGLSHKFVDINANLFYTRNFAEGLRQQYPAVKSAFKEVFKNIDYNNINYDSIQLIVKKAAVQGESVSGFVKDIESMLTQAKGNGITNQEGLSDYLSEVFAIHFFNTHAEKIAENGLHLSGVSIGLLLSPPYASIGAQISKHNIEDYEIDPSSVDRANEAVKKGYGADEKDPMAEKNINKYAALYGFENTTEKTQKALNIVNLDGNEYLQISPEFMQKVNINIMGNIVPFVAKNGDNLLVPLNIVFGHILVNDAHKSSKTLVIGDYKTEHTEVLQNDGFNELPEYSDNKENMHNFTVFRKLDKQGLANPLGLLLTPDGITITPSNNLAIINNTIIDNKIPNTGTLIIHKKPNKYMLEHSQGSDLLDIEYYAETINPNPIDVAPEALKETVDGEILKYFGHMDSSDLLLNFKGEQRTTLYNNVGTGNVEAAATQIREYLNNNNINHEIKNCFADNATNLVGNVRFFYAALSRSHMTKDKVYPIEDTQNYNAELLVKAEKYANTLYGTSQDRGGVTLNEFKSLLNKRINRTQHSSYTVPDKDNLVKAIMNDTNTSAEKVYKDTVYNLGLKDEAYSLLYIVAEDSDILDTRTSAFEKRLKKEDIGNGANKIIIARNDVVNQIKDFENSGGQPTEAVMDGQIGMIYAYGDENLGGHVEKIVYNPRILSKDGTTNGIFSKEIDNQEVKTYFYTEWEENGGLERTKIIDAFINKMKNEAKEFDGGNSLTLTNDDVWSALKNGTNEITLNKDTNLKITNLDTKLSMVMYEDCDNEALLAKVSGQITGQKKVDQYDDVTIAGKSFVNTSNVIAKATIEDKSWNVGGAYGKNKSESTITETKVIESHTDPTGDIESVTDPNVILENLNVEEVNGTQILIHNGESYELHTDVIINIDGTNYNVTFAQGNNNDRNFVVYKDGNTILIPTTGPNDQNAIDNLLKHTSSTTTDAKTSYKYKGGVSDWDKKTLYNNKQTYNLSESQGQIFKDK